RIVVEDRIVDACAMQLVLDPWKFAVLVTTNLFGDILSDLIAGLVGGLGMAPAGNIGTDAAIFEAVHGSAPDIAGKGVANPLALIMSGVMMLNHLHEETIASRIKAAYDAVLNEGKTLTRDLGGTAGTNDFTDALIAKLK